MKTVDTGAARGDNGSPRALRPGAAGELTFSVAATALGVFVVVDATQITVPGSVNTLGPRFFPYLVGAALIAIGALVSIRILTGHVGQPEEGEDVDTSAGTDWLTVAKLVAAFGAHIVLVEPLGWALAATVLFAGAAWTLGARFGARLVTISLILGFGIYLVFRLGLNVFLPAGIFEGVAILDG